MSSLPAKSGAPPFFAQFSIGDDIRRPEVRTARLQALTRAIALGLPTRRDERWRYADLRRLAGRRFGGPAFFATPVPPLGFPVALEVTLCGGVVHIPASLPAGVTIEQVLPDATDAISTPDPTAVDAFGALNAALAPGELRVTISAAARLDGPLVLTHLLPRGEAVASHPRVSITLAPDARTALIERFVGPAAGPTSDGLCNAVTHLTLGAGSVLELLHLQDQPDGVTHLAQLDATLGTGATLTLRALHLGALLGRLAARITLAGAGAKVEVDALNAIDGRRHGDLQLEVVHAAAATVSRQRYRGLASGRGKATATSRATVQRDAAGCDAAQSLGSLLLSPHAEVAARPELEIENDDVRCSHGATIGQLDEAALFYLRSRGLGDADARAALIFAFADDVLATLPRGPLRTTLESRLRARIGSSIPGEAFE